jgi:RHS repeat-associated protein
VSSLAYAYSDGMNLTGMTDGLNAANDNTLWYTAANRLQNANGPWGNTTNYYDLVGNRTYNINTVGASVTTRVQAYAANSNRLTGITENTAAFRTYTYDNAGNTLTETRPGESFAYAYNNRNRLASVTRNTLAYASYTYNALEQLTSRTTAAVGAPAGTVHYLYDQDGHLIAEANAATGAITRDYIWLASNDPVRRSLGEGGNDPIDLPLAIAENSTLTMVHADHLGRPTRMTDAARATVWQATWKPWGEVHSLSGSLTQNLRYPGQYFQIETGYHYNHHRHYDPMTGRYTQPDPLRFVDGPSVYAYAGNSPYMNTDRDGQIIQRFVAGAAIGAGFDLGIQLYNNGGRLECVDWGSVGQSALIGAGFGGIGRSAVEYGGTSLWRAFLRNEAGTVKLSGAYTIRFTNRMRYYGKGPLSRAQRSARELARKFNTTVSKIKWKQSPSSREGFKAEARLIEKGKGVDRIDNYNKINSPGVRYIREDGF